MHNCTRVAVTLLQVVACEDVQILASCFIATAVAEELRRIVGPTACPKLQLCFNLGLVNKPEAFNNNDEFACRFADKLNPEGAEACPYVWTSFDYAASPCDLCI